MEDTESLYIGYSKLDPTAVTETEIVGSVGTDGKETGLELLRAIYPMFGMTAGLLSAPGWSHNPTVAAAMEAKCTSINGVFSCAYFLGVLAGNQKLLQLCRIHIDNHAFLLIQLSGFVRFR